MVAGRDLPPASLVLDEEVSVLGPAEQVQHREILLENLFSCRGHPCALAATFLHMVTNAGEEN